MSEPTPMMGEMKPDRVISRLEEAIEREKLNLPLKASTVTINTMRDAVEAIRLLARTPPTTQGGEGEVHYPDIEELRRQGLVSGLTATLTILDERLAQCLKPKDHHKRWPLFLEACEKLAAHFVHAGWRPTALAAALHPSAPEQRKCDDGQCAAYRNHNGGCDLCGEPCI